MLAFRRSGKSPWVLAWLVCIAIALYSLWMCDRNATLQDNTRDIAETKRQADDSIVQNEGAIELKDEKTVESEDSRDMQPSALQVKEDQPLVTKIQRVVFYLWCGLNPDFMFANYLSLLSSVKFLQPHSIQYLYTKKPRVDRHFYNTWLDEFKNAYPYIEVKEVTYSFNCSHYDDMLRFMSGYLREGGIFMGTNTILTKPALHLWNETFLSDVIDARAGIIVANERHPQESFRRNGIECKNIQSVEDSVSSLCLHVPLEIKPNDIWHVESETGKLLNFLMYGSESTPVAKPNPQIVIPNVAHMLWLGGRKIDFIFYLSALSLLYIIKVDMLYIHGTFEPKREGYWGKLMEEPRTKYIKIVQPNKMFDQVTHSPHHTSDVFRAQIMERYGGIYSDVDAIWTQPLSDELRRYDAVAAFDWAHNYLYYPDYINLGVTMGRKGAPFWKHFTNSFKIIKDDVFGFNGLLQPYKIYERYPDTLKIQQNLQVMCFKEKCHPGWTIDWKSMNWKEETYAFHWTYPDPPEFQNEVTLMRNNSMWADIGKYVLQMAGKI